MGFEPSLEPVLQQYLEQLAKWNQTYNLTAVRDPAQMVSRHILDSLSIVAPIQELPAPTPLLDVGAGAGLPGLVLAIARPQWEVHLIDSNGKKARFMRHVQRTLSLGNVQIFEGRAEDFETDQRYAVITSRAFTSLDRFFASTEHLLSENGHWLAMKGRVDDNERQAVPPTVSIRSVIRLTVPGLHEQRHLVVAAPKS